MIGNEKNRISVVEYLQVDQIYIGCQQQKTIAENNDSRMSILALVWLWKRKYFGTLLCGLVTEIANLYSTMYIDIDTNGDFTTYAGFGITALLITRIVIPVLLAVLLIVYMKVNNLSLRYYIYKIQNLKYRINDASVIHIKEKQVEYFSHTVYTKDRSKCLPLADGAGYKLFSR